MQGIGYHRGSVHIINADLHLILGDGIHAGMMVIFHCHLGHLVVGCAVAAHMHLGHHGIERWKCGAKEAFPLPVCCCCQGVGGGA
jgi:hypothetical protein